MLQNNIIEPFNSSWSAPVVLVRKKDGILRFCVDYRKLNAVTKKNVYPMPRINDTLDLLAGSVIFSMLNLKSGYWQIEMDKFTAEKSAFATKQGLWQWKVMSFGFINAPATFQRLINSVLVHLK